MEEVETHRLVPEPRPRLSRSPDMVRLLPETPREADKTEDAIRLLVAAEAAGGGDELGEARGLLQTPCARSAANALTAIGDVARNCDGAALGAVKASERAVRDVVVLRCCSWGPVGAPVLSNFRKGMEADRRSGKIPPAEEGVSGGGLRNGSGSWKFLVIA